MCAASKLMAVLGCVLGRLVFSTSLVAFTEQAYAIVEISQT